MGLMTKEDKVARKINLAKLINMGGILFHDGKTTFAWIPTIKNGNIGRLGTVICHPNDVFKRKYGEHWAMINTGIGECLIHRYTVEVMQENLSMQDRV